MYILLLLVNCFCYLFSSWLQHSPEVVYCNIYHIDKPLSAATMPIQPPQWTEFLSCPVCYKKFNDSVELPISLGCGHTVCKACLSKLNQKKCPFDQAPISRSIEELPVNLALLQLAGATIPEQDIISISSISENFKYYDSARRCIGDLAGHLKCLATGKFHWSCGGNIKFHFRLPYASQCLRLN